MTSRCYRWWGHRLRGPQPDYGLGVIVAIVAAVTVWLAATPLVPEVAQATLARFHLRTDSFWGWAIQQPVPAMYNFANRYRVDGTEEAGHGKADHGRPEHRGPDATSPSGVSGAPIESGFVNHFPTRLFSFANARLRLLRDGEPRRFEFVSTYRGETIESRYLVTPGADGEWRVVLETWDHAPGSGCQVKKGVYVAGAGAKEDKEEEEAEEAEKGEEGESLKLRGTEDTEGRGGGELNGG